ncbi:MAG: hypothetical protein Q7I94_03045, partial [Candidatus Contubernalis sp.]|nr:hypothetical protein [Candidatus Contubernalis sp.]
EGENPHLGLMNLRVVRNAFGRQKDSFEADLEVPELGGGTFYRYFYPGPLRYLDRSGGRGAVPFPG